MSMTLQSAGLDLANALALCEVARSTRGQPGGQSNLMQAEMASGRFVAEHGAAVLKYLSAKTAKAGDHVPA